MLVKGTFVNLPASPNRVIFDTPLGLFWLTLSLLTLFFAAAATADESEKSTSEKSASEKSVSGKSVMALGDSLTAGYGLPTGDGFVPQLSAWLNARSKTPIRVVNAGVSGDTSSGGRARLAWSLAGVGGTPDLVILELGANDSLRGINPDVTRENLDAIVKSLQEKGIAVLIAGMMAPPNMGPDYAAQFNPIYPGLAARYDLPLYPFFLEGVAADPALNQADGIHPTKEGVAIIVDKMGPVILSALFTKGD